MKLDSNELALLHNAMSREVEYQKNYKGGVGHDEHISRCQKVLDKVYTQYQQERKKGN